MSSLLPTAAVHGRFQPFHLEHLDYLLRAFERAEFVHVGITQFENAQLRHVDGGGSHRQSVLANPLTYFERATVLSLALQGAGVDAERYRVGPFPIERPHDLAAFLPLEVPIFTTRVDEWNDRKVDLLSALGYQVEFLFERDPKGVSGSEIRDLMAAGDDRWVEKVPASTVEYLVSLKLADRLQPPARP
jgi:nicotinamide mononucleotide adenylyltransferase